jgi:hypothetical protein
MKNPIVGVLLLMQLPMVHSAAGQDRMSPPLANTRPPVSNLVPNEKTAVAVALAVLEPIYGAQLLKFESPFRATLKGGVWTVEGTLPAGYVGGVASVELSKDDVRIIRIVHAQ